MPSAQLQDTAMIPRVGFTNDEKSKMGEYLLRKAVFEEQRRILLQDLEVVEAKITEMQGEYGAIYNKRNSVLRLPVEVTCLIFTLAQLRTIDDSEDDSSEEEEEDDEEGDSLMEVVVSHVCHQWRSIALGFPKLWTSFHYESYDSAEVPLQRFDTYLKRSAALPLRIWFDFQTVYEDPDNLLLVEKAVDHAHRWQHFTMFSSDETVMEPLRLLDDVSAPMLEYLTILPGVDLNDNAIDPPTAMTNMDPCIFKGGAPKMTYLVLDGYSMRHALPPLSNITILRIEKPNCDMVPLFEPTPFLELLSLPSLTQLSLCGDLIAPFGRPRSIHMPNLKRFRVGEFDTIWDFLPSIRAPQLDTLIIHMCQVVSGQVAGATPSSPDRGYTFPALRKLYIIDSPVNRLDAPALTNLTSQATDVIISHGDLPTSLIQMIINGSYAHAAWPRLKILSCHIPDLVDHVDMYVNFAKSRKNPFVFRLNPSLFEFWEEGLEALRAVSSVELDEWELDEPFWPQDTDHDFGKDDGFSIGDYF